MGLYGVFVSLCLSGDVAALGADAFDVREAATERLKSWGVLAWPELVRARSNTSDPEVLYRVRAVLRPMDATAFRFRVAILWGCDWDAPEGWWDGNTRYAVFKLVQESRVNICWNGKNEWKVWAPWRLNPEFDMHVKVDGGGTYTTAQKCNAAMRHVRGVRSGAVKDEPNWPMGFVPAP